MTANWSATKIPDRIRSWVSICTLRAALIVSVLVQGFAVLFRSLFKLIENVIAAGMHKARPLRRLRIGAGANRSGVGIWIRSSRVVAPAEARCVVAGSRMARWGISQQLPPTAPVRMVG